MLSSERLDGGFHRLPYSSAGEGARTAARRHRHPSRPASEPEGGGARNGAGHPNATRSPKATEAGIPNRLSTHGRVIREAVPSCEAELRALEPIAELLAARYQIPGSDRDDVRQIARIGIWEAIECWDGSTPLRAFARLVAERRVQDALTGARRLCRHAEQPPLSLSAGAYGEDGDLNEIVPAPGNAAELAELRVELGAVVAALPSLTPLERASLAAVLNGIPYSIEGVEGVQGFDNGLQRARRKLRAAVASDLAA